MSEFPWMRKNKKKTSIRGEEKEVEDVAENMQEVDAEEKVEETHLQ